MVGMYLFVGGYLFGWFMSFACSMFGVFQTKVVTGPHRLHNGSGTPRDEK